MGFTYECKYCDYRTDRRYCSERHEKSEKHLRNIEGYNYHELDVIAKKLCDYICSNKGNLDDFKGKEIDYDDLFDLTKSIIVDKSNEKKIISGYIYILHNKSYQKNTYKIGKTINILNRLDSYKTGYVEDSKTLYISDIFPDYSLAERIIFIELDQYRVNKNREFFECDVDTIIDTIKTVKTLFAEKSVYDIRKQYELEEVIDVKKAIEKLEQLDIFTKDIDPNNFVCEYCDKFIKFKSNKARHYKNCKQKQKVEKYEKMIVEKDKLLVKKDKTINEKNKQIHKLLMKLDKF